MGWDFCRVSYLENNVKVHTNFFFLLTSQTYINNLLIFVLLCIRIKAKYCYREIEDIVVYDRSKKTKLDFDSPAILETFFAELHEFENEPFYYRKEVSDLRRAESQSIKTLT